MSAKLPSFVELNPAACIKLADGRAIMLERLLQSQTYGGLLLGLPGEWVNESVLKSARCSAKEEVGALVEPFFIQPVQLPFMARRRVRMMSRDGALSDGEGEIEEHTDYRLPLVRCIGWFRCPQTVAPPAGLGVFDYSIAAIVWFQDAYAMPIAKEVLDEIRLLDWVHIARDVSD